jgi:hypothetical protein
VTHVEFHSSVLEMKISINHPHYHLRGVFSGCRQLRIVILNDGLKEIGCAAFYGCNLLIRIIVTSSVKKIRENVSMIAGD